jgi:mannose-6-phosphate isomerase
MSQLLLMDNPIRDYDWGSTSALPRLLREPPTGRPQAELWMGAHHSTPSTVDSTSLADRIAADPIGELGERVVEEYGPRLPFMLKVLAAASPLSLQAHPSSAQARAGFAAENARGIALDARERNYKDDNHKPELICALTPFRALGGFRPLADTARLLDGLDVPALRPYRALLDEPDGLRTLVGTWLEGPVGDLVAAVAAACDADLSGEFAAEREVVVDLAAAFPGDAGVLIALLLNYVRLEPGQAFYMPAGNLHTYLSGTGVEILANSDNVLRGGFTSKHVDPAELLSILDFAAGPPDLVVPVAGAGGDCHDYRVPVRDFLLSRHDVAGQASTVEGGRPQILLCTSGSIEVSDVDGSSVVLPRGRSAYLPASQKYATLTGRGTLFRATTNLG